MIDYYYYRSYHSAQDGRKYKMYIVPEGITIDFDDGTMLDTGLVPSNIHPKKEKLSPKEIEDFHRFIKFLKYDLGWLYTREEYIEIKKRYRNQLKSHTK